MKYIVEKSNIGGWKVRTHERNFAYYPTKKTALRDVKTCETWYAQFEHENCVIMPVGGKGDLFKIVQDADYGSMVWYRYFNELSTLHAQLKARNDAAENGNWRTPEERAALAAAEENDKKKVTINGVVYKFTEEVTIHDAAPAVTAPAACFEVAIIPTEYTYGQYEMEYTTIELPYLPAAPAVLPFSDTAWAAQS